ncbi:MAG: hypothetical protein HYV95_17085 [Opitutae bacterium]|nr:hypothetical protein [Opitutae bacterium]
MLLLLALGPLVRAKSTDNTTADSVLDRWIGACGGDERLKAIKATEYQTRYTNAQGFVWELREQCRSDGAHRGVMQTRSGELVIYDDGHTGWMQHVAFGAGLLPTDEVERNRRTSGPQESLRVRASFPQRQLLSDETINGKTVHVIELIDAKGWREHWVFSVTTGLRVRREVYDPKGRQVVDYSDFRKIDGVIEPFHGVSTQNGNVTTIEVLSANHRAKPDESSWSPPAELVADLERIEQTLARFRAAAGQPVDLAKVKTRFSRGHVEVTTSGVTFATIISQKAPNKILIEQEVPGMGKVLQGFDGAIGWAWSELQGYRQLVGPELAQLVAIGELHPITKLGEQIPLRKWLGERTEKDGRKLAVIELATVQGSAGVHYFDVATGLLVRVETIIQAGPGGMLKVTADIGDYRRIDGELIAFSNTITNPAMRLVTTLDSVEHNRELADEIFHPRKSGELPAAAPAARAAAKPVAPQ